MIHIMLDLETLGTSSHAAIISVGAVRFDVMKGFVDETFYEGIDIDSSVDAGGIIDDETIEWWKQQSPEAQAVLNSPGLPIERVLEDLRSWLNGIRLKHRMETLSIWGNGSDFDNVILCNAYKRMGIPPPWTHRENRCYRTVASLYPDVLFRREGIHHNALYDAISQAKHLIRVFQLIQTGKFNQ